MVHLVRFTFSPEKSQTIYGPCSETAASDSWSQAS
jgi:hypothetical protein